MKSQFKHQNLRLHPFLMVGGGLAIASELLTGSALAQSISIDGSTPTQLDNNNSCSGSCTITGGLRDGSGSGSNLFHSFSTFNVGTGATVTFEDPGVTNIFSRITAAGSLSTIDGTLKVDGAANLFLLNPNGILFGEDASLDLQGSFLSSTAESILFQDQTSFSAIAISDIPSLLTVSTPIGLQFGSTPGPIEVQGSGHQLFYGGAITRNPFGPPDSGLTSAIGENLAFLGGDVSLQGGNLLAEGGHVEIGSVGANGQVGFDSGAPRWQFNYEKVFSFQDISLSESASVDVSSGDAGSIQLQGRQITLSSGSALLSQVASSGSGEITISAAEKLQLTGENIFEPSNFFTMPTSVYVEIAPSGSGDGNSLLSVNAPEIELTGGAQIGLTMAGAGQAGNVKVQSQIIQADGVSNAGPSAIFTTVAPFNFTSPNATGGDLSIRTQQLNVTNGGTIGANTFGPGSGGDLTITAHELNVDGFSINSPSIVGTSSAVSPTTSLAPPTAPPALIPGGSGDSGSATISTRRLTVTNGGQVSTGIASDNEAGSLTIRASEFIELDGETESGRSGLFSNAFEGSGSGGNVIVVTDVLSVLNGATINTSNFSSSQDGRNPGSGPAGNINLTTQTLEVKDGSVITADTVAGDRANITLQTDSLVLRRGSNITTNATGSATGGDINIDTTALIAFENSDITANATDDFGGRVVIEAETILGTAFREELTPQSDITATSELGPAFSGSVEINNPEDDPTEGIVDLPEGLAAADQIVAACERLDSNTFIATGRGGLPESASQFNSSQSLWNDFRLLENGETLAVVPGSNASVVGDRKAPNIELASAPSNIVEAQTWTTNEKGQTVLDIYTETANSPHTVASCLAQ